MYRSFAAALLLAISAGLAAGPPAPAPGGCGGEHIVVAGDTLYSIARRCRSTVVAIAQASRLADPRRIEVGQRLVIPGGRAPAPAPEPAAGDSRLSYRFATGDTLYSLARWAGVGVGALLAANPGVDPHRVEIGDAVRLPAGARSPDAARLRERGRAPPPQAVQRRPLPPPPHAPVVHPRAAPPPAHAHVDSHPVPPPPHARPAQADEREPEGM